MNKRLLGKKSSIGHDSARSMIEDESVDGGDMRNTIPDRIEERKTDTGAANVKLLFRYTNDPLVQG